MSWYQIDVLPDSHNNYLQLETNQAAANSLNMAPADPVHDDKNVPHLQITVVSDSSKLHNGPVQRPPKPTTPQTAGKPPTIYLIRHGEKNGLNGLDPAGWIRASTLPLVLNDEKRTNPYDIRLILAMQPQPVGDQERPYQTIWPLFLSLSQAENNYCLLDNSVHEECVQLAARRIKEYIASGSPGNILVCWEHKNLTNILEAFGFVGAPEYPKSFDVVWVMEPTAKLDESQKIQLKQPALQSTGPKATGDYGFNPDDDGTKEKRLWSWNKITWYFEGIDSGEAVDDKGHAIKPDNPSEWIKQEGLDKRAPTAMVAGVITTTPKDSKTAPTCAWEPYKHHQLDHPKTNSS